MLCSCAHLIRDVFDLIYVDSATLFNPVLRRLVIFLLCSKYWVVDWANDINTQSSSVLSAFVGTNELSKLRDRKLCKNGARFFPTNQNMYYIIGI